MLAATKVKKSCSENKDEQENEEVSGSFKSFVCAKQRYRNVQKKVCCTCKNAFLLIGPIVVFFSPFSLNSPLSIKRFYICLRKL